MRASGILLPIFSLPSEYGIGDLYKEAFRFVDWLQEAKQRYWQVLPIGPVNKELCPYQSSSSFAGESLLISLDQVCQRMCNVSLTYLVLTKCCIVLRISLLFAVIQRIPLSLQPLDFHRFLLERQR